MSGKIYTETMVHSAPEAFVADAPYQLVIVTLEDGNRVTGRIVGERVSIDDPVTHVEDRNGVPYFQSTPQSTSQKTS
jgi:uncharacterized OB-fold protein